MTEMDSSTSGSSSLKKIIGVLLLSALFIASGAVLGVKFLWKSVRNQQAPSAAPVVPPPIVPVDPVPASPVVPPIPELPAGVVAARKVIGGTMDERKAGIDQLRVIEGPQDEAVAELIAALSSSSSTSKTDVVWALAVLGPRSAAAVPLLKKMKANKKERLETRNAAGAALKKIAPATRTTKTAKSKSKKR